MSPTAVSDRRCDQSFGHYHQDYHFVSVSIKNDFPLITINENGIDFCIDGMSSSFVVWTERISMTMYLDKISEIKRKKKLVKTRRKQSQNAKWEKRDCSVDTAETLQN